MIDKVYVTKYALTDGVRLCRVVEVDTISLKDDVCVKVKWPGAIGNWLMFTLGKDAHVTYGDARWAFDEMREKAIKAAERKLDRLRAMKFEVKE